MGLNGLNGCINSTRKVQRSQTYYCSRVKGNELRIWHLVNVTWRLLFSLYHHHIRQISVCLIWCEIVCTVRLFQSVSNKYHSIYYAANIKQNNEKNNFNFVEFFLPNDVTFFFFFLRYSKTISRNSTYYFDCIKIQCFYHFSKSKFVDRFNDSTIFSESKVVVEPPTE